jgi:hypothetical protein
MTIVNPLKRWFVFAAVMLSVLLFSLAAYSLVAPVHRTTVMVCPGCGKYRTQTTMIGLTRSDSVSENELSSMLQDRIRPKHTHRWVLMSSTTSNARHMITSCTTGPGNTILSLLNQLSMRTLPSDDFVRMLRRIEMSDRSQHEAIRDELMRFPVVATTPTEASDPVATK